MNKVSTTRYNILLYGDVNLNIIDGSAIWLTSMAEVLARAGCQVSVLLKTAVTNDRLIKRLSRFDSISILQPWEDMENHESHEALSPRYASRRMLGLHSHHEFDAVIVRGYSVSKFVAGSERLAPISWLYITDLPVPAGRISEQQISELRKLCAGAFRLFAQTEDARSYLEAIAPEAAGKTLVLPPMIPDEFFKNLSESPTPRSDNLSLVYSGKFAEDWRTREMLDLPASLSALGIHSILTLIGDKFQKSKSLPTWHLEMQEAIKEAPQVTWLGGMSRFDAMDEVRKHDIGLGWRSTRLDSSMEVSTKALEYAALGVPPMVNRTAAHERLFGKDYPLFVDSSLESVLKVLGNEKLDINFAREQAQQAVQPYAMNAAAERMARYLSRAIPDAQVRPTPLKVILAGHDLKFAGEIIDLLRKTPSIELSVDKWATLHEHDEQKSTNLLASADVVICEWCGPNAVWYSQNKRQDQKLFVRLHAFELRGPWLSKIDIDQVDKIFTVSKTYKLLTIEATGWPESKIDVIPNLLDTEDFDRPKLAGAEFRLGLVGIVPFIKRPDRALAVLDKLLEVDERYSLHIRGRMPWEYSYEWTKGIQREAYESFFSSIGNSERFRNAVAFEAFGPDMANWMRKIGYVLSPSTRESFHMAPLEGMASGAIPVVWDRPGADEIFGRKFVVEDSQAAATRIIETNTDADLRRMFSQSSVTRAAEYDSIKILQNWLATICA